MSPAQSSIAWDRLRGVTALVGLSFLVAVVLFVRADYIPFGRRLVLLLPVTLAFALGALGLWRWTSWRMASGSRSVWPDVLSLTVVAAALLLVGLPVFLLLPLAVGVAAGFLFLIRRRSGPFFAVLVGSALLFLVLLAARLLVLEEQLLLVLEHRAFATRAREGSGARWVFAPETRALRVGLPDETVLGLNVPRGFYLHSPGEASFQSELPAVGRPVVFLSDSVEEPFASPLCAVFTLGAESPHTPGDFREAVWFALGHRRSRGAALEPKFEGTTELRNPAGGAILFGIRFSYLLPSGGAMRELLYVTTGPRGRQLALFCRFARSSAWEMDPQIERLLGSARWEAGPPSGKLE